jgi:hypothetical protein
VCDQRRKIKGRDKEETERESKEDKGRIRIQSELQREEKQFKHNER